MANVLRDGRSGVSTPPLLQRWTEDYSRGRYTAVVESWCNERATMSLQLLACDTRALEAVGWSLALTKSWDAYTHFRTDLQAFAADATIAAVLSVLENWRLVIHEARYDASIVGLRKLQSELMETTSPRLLAHALKVEGVALFRIGRYIEAEAHMRRAADLFRLSGDALNLAHCMTNLGLVLNARGEIRAARDELRLAVVTLVEADAAEERISLARENLGITEAHLGNEETARGLYESALEVFERHGLVSEQVTALNGLGHCARLRGRFDLAHRWFTTALERTDTEMPRQIGLCHEFLGQIEFDRGGFDAAEAHYRHALEHAASIAPDGDLMVEASWRLAELLVVCGRVEEAMEHLTRAESLCHRFQDRREIGCVQRVRARVQAARGQAQESSATFASAVETLDRCGRAFEAALTRIAQIEIEIGGESSLGTAALLQSTRACVQETLPASTWLLERLDRLASDTDCLAESQRHGFVTGDPDLLALLESLPELATSVHPVLIEGESGTGKELVARALHALSGREGAFVAVNCAAIPRDLFESELFGHARGAFSGAGGEKPGLLEQAADGTLLLDEIGEMPHELQAKLLRFLDDGVLRRIGELRERNIKLKIVAATNQSLRRNVAGGLFRADLFHRLAVHTLEIKPLRQRPGDIAHVARHLLRQEKLDERLTLTPVLLADLEAQPWPGNVRELRNDLIRRAVQSRAAVPAVATAPPASSLRASRRDHEQQRIEGALRSHGGNASAAARALGMHVTTLRRKMHTLGIDRPS